MEFPLDLSDIGFTLAGMMLRRDGFVVLKQIFSPAEVREVERATDALIGRMMAGPPGSSQRHLEDLTPARDAGLRPGSRHSDWKQPELKYASRLSPELQSTSVFQKCAAIGRHIGGHLSCYFDHVIYKLAQSASPTPWHQDCAFFRVPGKQARRLHFWIPMQDTDLDNGCLSYIPGSHLEPMRVHRSYRRQIGRHLGKEAEPCDVSRAVACPVPLGGLIIHTPYTLHTAAANNSRVVRKAWILHFAPFGEARVRLQQLCGRVPGRLSS